MVVGVGGSSQPVGLSELVGGELLGISALLGGVLEAETEFLFAEPGGPRDVARIGCLCWFA
jgi:hypothetical protein